MVVGIWHAGVSLAILVHSSCLCWSIHEQSNWQLKFWLAKYLVGQALDRTKHTLNSLLMLCLDVDIEGHGIELAPISNLLDFDIDIESEFYCLDVHGIDTCNSHKVLNSQACLDGHSLHWNCTLM